MTSHRAGGSGTEDLPPDGARPAATTWAERWRALGQASLWFLMQLEGLSNAPPPPPEPIDPSRLAGTIRYGTIELACLHEAGHVAAAFAARAHVVRAEIDLNARAPGGRTRVRHTMAQRQTISLGGFAVELQLWRTGRLRWFDGSWPSEADMRRGVGRSSHDDRVKYFGRDLRTPDDRWPAHADDAFFRAADALCAQIDFDLVQRVAGGLFTQLRLREREIALLAAAPLFAAGAPPSRVRLAATSGLNRRGEAGAGSPYEVGSAAP